MPEVPVVQFHLSDNFQSLFVAIGVSVAPAIVTNLILNLIPNLISGLSGSGHIFHYQTPNLISGSQPDIRLQPDFRLTA